MDSSLIFILVISILGFLVFRFFTRRKKPVVKEPLSMADLGFSAIPFPEADFKMAITRLHHKYSGQQLAVADVFQKVVDQEYVYILDLEDQAEKDHFFLARDMVAIRSPEFDLPRMTIMTRLKAMGGLGNLMDRFVSRHSNWESNLQGLIQLDYDNNPIISQRYLIFSTAESEELVRLLLSDTRLNFLAGLDTNYVIDTQGDTLTIMNATINSAETRKVRIERTIQDAISLAILLKNKASALPSS